MGQMLVVLPHLTPLLLGVLMAKKKISTMGPAIRGRVD